MVIDLGVFDLCQMKHIVREHWNCTVLAHNGSVRRNRNQITKFESTQFSGLAGSTSSGQKGKLSGALGGAGNGVGDSPKLNHPTPPGSLSRRRKNSDKDSVSRAAQLIKRLSNPLAPHVRRASLFLANQTQTNSGRLN